MAGRQFVSRSECCSLCSRSSVSGDLQHRVWLCIDCDRLICESCWPNVRPAHDTAGTGWRGIDHERIDPLIQRRLEDVFHPPFNEDELDMLYKADEGTTWFGVGKERNGKAFLTDGGVYQALMSRSYNEERRRYPQIASFIGETNAGKSTLIKMLIEFAEHRQSAETGFTFPSPIVGPRDASDPTSVDVHMYADPSTFATNTPLLYADCEGLAGGEQIPRAGRLGHEEHRRKAVNGGALRFLRWAKTPEQRRRSYTVAELYPRLLYTFSDVVVFVTTNKRAFEEYGLERLLKWGHAALEKSVNQASLPHLIVVANAVDDAGSEDKWKVRNSTNELLQAVRGSINSIPAVAQFAHMWRHKSRQIRSTRDLILCYYSSFNVVQIPREGRRTKLMLRQLQLLRTQIKSCCQSSYDNKSQARLLSKSSELGMFMQAAFDHFSRTLDRPFNFVDVSLRISPIPKNIGGNLLQLAIAVQAKDKSLDSEWIFKKLGKVAASCILLDCVRTGRKGDPIGHIDKYQRFMNDMLNEFCFRHSPCMFSNKRGECVNTRGSHTKGHQDSKGKILALGPYSSEFTFETYRDEWELILHEDIKTVTEEFKCELRYIEGEGEGTDDDTIAMDLHSERLERFYAETKQISEFRSHESCICCFIHVPEHVLPCGHVLCTSCVRAWAFNKEELAIQLDCCPLHPDQTAWNPYFIIRFKPSLAGVRVLSLDGGGIRGIVEIEVLRAIQKELGARNCRKIPIHVFFDLIIGTSTGGLIALAIGAKGWDLETVNREFRELSSAAFTKREFAGIWVLEKMATFYHSSVYKTRPLYTALKEALGETPLFGARRERPLQYDIKVAVTSTNEEGSRPLLLSNYNRQNKDAVGAASAADSTEAYDFLRPHLPNEELAIWEAAAATSAATPYFKPFYHGKSLKHFLDGAFYNNNPARVAKREAALLWPDTRPDILVSIGTSQNKRNVDLDLEDVRRREARHSRSQRPRRDFTPFPNSRQILTAMKGRVDNILNSQKAWYDFIDTTSEKERYVRLNPDIREDPPKLYEVERLNELQSATQTAIRRTAFRSEIKKVARMLIASTFYFQLQSPPTLANGSNTMYNMKGTIACRFKDTTSNLRDLGLYFRSHSFSHFQPYFEISTDEGHIPQQRHITTAVVQEMIDFASWRLDAIELPPITRRTVVHISLHLVQSEEPFAISGFPRSLISEDDVALWKNMRLDEEHNLEYVRLSRRRTRAGQGKDSSTRPSHRTTGKSVTHPEQLFKGRNELQESQSSASELTPGNASIISELPADPVVFELSTRPSTSGRVPVPSNSHDRQRTGSRRPTAESATASSSRPTGHRSLGESPGRSGQIRPTPGSASATMDSNGERRPRDTGRGRGATTSGKKQRSRSRSVGDVHRGSTFPVSDETHRRRTSLPTRSTGPALDRTRDTPPLAHELHPTLRPSREPDAPGHRRRFDEPRQSGPTLEPARARADPPQLGRRQLHIPQAVNPSPSPTGRAHSSYSSIDELMNYSRFRSPLQSLEDHAAEQDVSDLVSEGGASDWAIRSMGSMSDLEY